MPKVFISYSHKDEAWKDKLLPHLEALEQAGMGMVVWQDRRDRRWGKMASRHPGRHGRRGRRGAA